MTSDNFFSRRWHNRIPLSVLLWRDMLGVGTLINLTATLMALIALTQGAHLAIALALHFAPMPYNVFLVAALWRAPDRHPLAMAVAAGWLLAVTFL